MHSEFGRGRRPSIASFGEVTASANDRRRAVRALVDRQRLAIAGALATRDRSLDELVATTHTSQRSTLEALAELRTSGLVDVSDGRYRLNDDALRALASSVGETVEPAAASILDGASDDDRAMLERFFRGTELVEIPTSRPKRRVVLERLAREFDVGTHYSEAAVNERLGGFHPDVAALRRYLVDEELLDRAEGHYWRCGGRVET